MEVASTRSSAPTSASTRGRPRVALPRAISSSTGLPARLSSARYCSMASGTILPIDAILGRRTGNQEPRTKFASHEDHRHHRPCERLRGHAGRANRGRHRHFPPEFFARHARVSRRDVRARARGVQARGLRGRDPSGSRRSENPHGAAGGGRRPIALAPGGSVTIVTGDGEGGPGRLFTTFEGLAKSVRTGDRLLLSDGHVELRVDSTTGSEIQATVVEGGEIGEHKGINAPGVPLPTSAITAKDVDDLKFGLSLGVDMVALSFVQTAADVLEARRILDEAHAGGVPLIAKLERPLALEHLEEILERVQCGDGGARRSRPGDAARARAAGPEGNYAPRTPRRQAGDRRDAGAGVDDRRGAADPRRGERRRERRRGWRGCHHARRRNRRRRSSGARRQDAQRHHRRRGERAATRRVVRCSDVGRHRSCARPLRGRRHARRSQRRAGHRRRDPRRDTARSLSALRPRAPIIAATEREGTGRRLMLYWGVVPLCMPIGENLDEASARIGAELVERGLVSAGAACVFVSINAGPEPARRELSEDSPTVTTDIRYTTVGAVILAFAIAAVAGRIAHALIHRALGALDVTARAPFGDAGPRAPVDARADAAGLRRRGAREHLARARALRRQRAAVEPAAPRPLGADPRRQHRHHLRRRASSSFARRAW